VQVEARNTAILNAALDAVVVIDQQGAIVDFNPAAEAMFGYSKDEVTGQSMAGTIIPISLRERHSNSFKRHIATGEATIIGKRLELTAMRRGGVEFPIELVVSRVDVNDDILFAAHIRDISERKEFEERLMRDAQELARANSDLQQFAYITSHDLQEPLRTISSYVDLLNRSAGPSIPEESRDYLDFIKEGARRMDALVQDLLLFARVSNQEVELKRVDIPSTLDWALQNLEAAIEETGAVISRGSLPDVLGSRVHLVQLFQNLIANSLKYCGEQQPRIHISAVREGSEWIFSVKDNGIGIAPEQHQRIFEIFKRLHGRSVPGTGIGLAVCKRIVERHGGRIWVESEPGKGSEFKFALPAPYK
jgi:PAS domain S-box-containing protein